MAIAMGMAASPPRTGGITLLNPEPSERLELKEDDRDVGEEETTHPGEPVSA